MLLKNETLQQELKQNGFVVVPFLSEEEVVQLNSFYEEVNSHQEPPDFIDGIHMTSWCKSSDYKKNVSTHLESFFKEATDKFFEKTRQLNHVFIVKKSGKNTTFKVHQDWNVIDENKYESVNVWIPLHDVDENSGALWVLKGSHQIKRKIRGSGYLFPDYSPFFTELEAASTSVKLKAGEAIVFYHSMIHGSPPNMASNDRKAACFTVIPKEAPLCIYFQPTAKDPLQQYEPADDFMYQYDYLRTETLSKPPAKEPVKTMASIENKKVELSELNSFLKKEKKGFFSFLKG